MSRDAALKHAVQALSENMPAFVYLKDRAGRFIEVKRAVADLHGPPPEAMAGHTLWLFHGDRAEQYPQDGLVVVRSGAPLLNVVELLPLGDGETRWIEVGEIPVRDDQTKAIGVLVIATAITEMKKARRALAESSTLPRTVADNLAAPVTRETLAEEALRKSEERYRTLSEVAPVAIFRTGPDGRCSYVNDLWYSITGVAPNQSRGQCWTEALAPDHRDPISEAWRPIAESDGVFNADAQIASADASEVWVLVRVAVERDVSGTTIGFVGTLTDISCLKQVEARLRSTEQELRDHRDQLWLLVEQRTQALREAQHSLLLRERLAAIGQLTATVSHELRNPLGTITASFGALKRCVDLTEREAQRICERIDRNLKRCDSIIDDLLSHTRIDTLNQESLDLDTWLGLVLSELDLPDWVTLISDLKVERSVRLDPRLMRQAVSNLVANAVDAMKETSEPSLLEIVSRSTDDGVQVTIRDTGPGLPQGDLEKVFEPLVSTKSFGIGLGLPLVRRIIELHGGSVAIENGPRGGAEAKILLPCGRRSERAPLKAESDGGETRHWRRRTRDRQRRS